MVSLTLYVICTVSLKQALVGEHQRAVCGGLVVMCGRGYKWLMGNEYRGYQGRLIINQRGTVIGEATELSLELY